MPQPTYLTRDQMQVGADLGFRTQLDDAISQIKMPTMLEDATSRLKQMAVAPIASPSMPMQFGEDQPFKVQDLTQSIPGYGVEPEQASPGMGAPAMGMRQSQGQPVSGGGATFQGGSNPEGQAAVYRAARAAGRSDEDARILASVTETEGGWGGAVGDNGQSRGIYQFHERGEMPAFRAWLQQNGIEGDPNQLAYDPDIATRYAATTYLGSALDQGRAQGLSGADLATFVQRTGQRSVSPERTGQNYERLSQQQAAAPVQTATPQGIAQGGNWRETWGDNLTPDQIKETLNAGLDWDAALATCGVAAAVAFARANNRNPTFKEALDLAQASGEWDRNVGMKRGTTGQIELLRKMGVDATARPVNEQEIAQTVTNGQPVQINAHGGGGHFYVASGYNPQTRQFYFGNSASILKASGGRQWFRLDELPSLGVGTPTDAIYMGASR